MAYHDHHGDDRFTRPPWAGQWGGPPTASATLRISDADRTEVTNALCRHFGDGRLDESELEDRLARAGAAKTQSDLAPLLADLPPLGGGLPTPTRRRRRGGSLMLPLAAATLAVVFALTALNALIASLDGHLFRPHIPWVLVLVVAIVIVRRHRRSHQHHHT